MWAAVPRRIWWKGFTGLSAEVDFSTWRDEAKQEALVFAEQKDELAAVETFLGMGGADQADQEEMEKGNLLLYRDEAGRQLRAVLVVDSKSTEDTREIYPGLRIYFAQWAAQPWHVYLSIEGHNAVQSAAEANQAFGAVRAVYKELSVASAHGFKSAASLRFQPFGFARK